LAFSDDIIIYKKQTKQAKLAIANADLVICLDFNSLNRADKAEYAIRNTQAFKVLIDHHQQPECFADLIISDTAVSSTSELLYEIILQAEYMQYVDSDVAEALYVGIMTDTGSFSYSCNRSRTFFIVSRLIEYGIDVAAIHQKVYDTNSEERLRLLGHCLSKKLVVLDDCNTAYIYLDKKELKEFNYKKGDTEGVVNYALSLKGINLAAIFIEKENMIKVSFRSKGSFSVNEFARKHFNGGGHNNAAGGESYVSLEKSIKEFENLLENYKKIIAASNRN
jgi:phosphoesterase RecJ-like protein